MKKINKIASNLLNKTENKFKELGYYDKLMNSRNSHEWKKILKKVDRDLGIFVVDDVIKRIASRKMNYIKQKKHLRNIMSNYSFSDFIQGLVLDEKPKIKYEHDDLMENTFFIDRVVDMFGEEFLLERKETGRSNGEAWN